MNHKLSLGTRPVPLLRAPGSSTAGQPARRTVTALAGLLLAAFGLPADPVRAQAPAEADTPDGLSLPPAEPVDPPGG